MPIEIRELVIKAVIGEPGADKAKAAKAQPSKEREEIIRDCIEQILQILREQQER